MASIFEENEDDDTFLNWTPKLKKCCCFSLETGTKLIGYFQIVLYGLLSLHTLYDEVVLPQIKNYDYYDVPKFLELSYFSKSIFASFLLIGVHKENRGYLLAWLLVTQLIQLENFILVILDVRYNNQIYEIIIFYCIDLCMYFLLVVHSYYCSLFDVSPSNNNYPQIN